MHKFNIYLTLMEYQRKSKVVKTSLPCYVLRTIIFSFQVLNKNMCCVMLKVIYADQLHIVFVLLSSSMSSKVYNYDIVYVKQVFRILDSCFSNNGNCIIWWIVLWRDFHDPLPITFIYSELYKWTCKIIYEHAST